MPGLDQKRWLDDGGLRPRSSRSHPPRRLDANRLPRSARFRANIRSRLMPTTDSWSTWEARANRNRRKGGNVLGHRDEAQELPSNDTWIAFQKHTVINAGALFRGQERVNAVRRERRRIVRRPQRRREDRAIGGCPARSCRRLPTVKKSLPARTRNSNGFAVRVSSPRFVFGGFAPAPPEQVRFGAPPLVLGPRPQNVCSHLQTACWLDGVGRGRTTSGRGRTP